MLRIIFFCVFVLWCGSTVCEAQGVPPKLETKVQRAKAADPTRPFVFKVVKARRVIAAEYTPSYCPGSGDVEGTLLVSGRVGDSARLDLMCGETVVASCTATVPAGGGAIKCKIPKQAVPNEGKLTCPVTVLVGGKRLLYSSECVDP